MFLRPKDTLLQLHHEAPTDADHQSAKSKNVLTSDAEVETRLEFAHDRVTMQRPPAESTT